MIDNKLIEDIILKHYHYLERTNFQGWDVLDGLNSRLFQKLPFHNNKYFRLFWIQLFRKSPINFRTFTGVPKEYNPKAVALFISSLLNLYQYFKKESFRERALDLYQQLMHLQSQNYSGLCWGYNFDWQARAFNVPKFKPNMVCSVFAGQALLDQFESTRVGRYLNEARQVVEFIMNNLVLIEESDKICFGYIPGEPVVIHNVNLLGAAYLSRLFDLTDQSDYRLLAEKSVRFSVTHQRPDGAWAYGNQRHHQWVDNFHTGYKLVALYQYQVYCKDDQFEPALVNGIEFHLNNHFSQEMLPAYSDVKLYPLDIHCFAQAIITFSMLKRYIPDYEQRIAMIVKNVLAILWDQKAHYFWYKKSRFFTSKIPYIRWSQAWMLYSLSKLMTQNSSITNQKFLPQ